MLTDIILIIIIIIINHIISELHIWTATVHKSKAVNYGVLTFAGQPITSQAESGTTAAAPGFVAPAEKADVRASSWFTKRVNFTRMALDWREETGVTFAISIFIYI